MKTIKDINPKDKTILIRTDYNVPLKSGQITDDLRIKASLPTINYLLENGAKKIILISHLGRPDGHIDPTLSLAPIAIRLQELLPDQTIHFVDQTTGPAVEQAVDTLPNHAILLLENLRFDPGEEANSPDFARAIVDSTHADLFVQDGFAVLHRVHASTDAITHLLPSVAGLLVAKEVTTLESAITDPIHPVLLILGGAKVADKQPLIDKFNTIADHVAIAGKIAAEGYTTSDPKIFVATDFITDSTAAKLDIGPESTAKIIELINPSNTIIWNGLTGKAEDPDFSASSQTIAETIGEQPASKTTIICGGDTAGFVENLLKTNPSLHFTLISTGGGASLDLLSGQPLPGLIALEVSQTKTSLPQTSKNPPIP